MKSHKMLHTEKKSFGCEFCQSKFNQKEDLRMQVARKHIKEKNYLCQLCNNRFVTKGAMLEKNHSAINFVKRALGPLSVLFNYILVN